MFLIYFLKTRQEAHQQVLSEENKYTKYKKFTNLKEAGVFYFRYCD